MSGGEPADTRSNRAEEGFPPVSRRAVLASSAAAGATGLTTTAAATETGDGAAEVRLSDLLVRQEDLREPDSYLEWSIDAADAPLARHLDSAVEGFVPADGAMSGFVGTAAADGPDAIESAAYPARTTEAVTAATEAWASQRDDAADTVVREGDGVRQWETVTDEGLDVLRLQRLPGDVLGFVGASGPATRTDPREAVDHYAVLIGTRAER